MDTIPRPDGADVNIGARSLIVCWSLYGIAGAIVAARLYAQAIIIRKFEWEDIIIVLAIVFGILQMVLVQLSYGYGFGRHFFYLEPQQRVMIMKMQFIAMPLCILSTTAGRVSVALLMLRLFGSTQYRQRFLYFLIAQSVAVNLITIITIFTQCKPVSSIWDPIGVPGKCWDPKVQSFIGYFQGACNSITDLVLTCLTNLFNSASIACIIKTIELKDLSERADYAYDSASKVIWGVVENTIIMMGASIPLLRSFVTRSKTTKGGVFSTYTGANNSRSIQPYPSFEGSLLPVELTGIGNRGEGVVTGEWSVACKSKRRSQPWIEDQGL
ncbi:uncharacterized protein PAC_10691 [Phialocephala subalpina]|uniref:Rhodopsin domain-containing protein n=1 Tax=Phialocephala subalpina TaxID=576137 RepID=A0A1L7X6Z2_9HELO|nr:uncharacterized protein PAC_10691 [Phialocephala subalpina]